MYMQHFIVNYYNYYTFLLFQVLSIEELGYRKRLLYGIRELSRGNPEWNNNSTSAALQVNRIDISNTFVLLYCICIIVLYLYYCTVFVLLYCYLYLQWNLSRVTSVFETLSISPQL